MINNARVTGPPDLPTTFSTAHSSHHSTLPRAMYHFSELRAEEGRSAKYKVLPEVRRKGAQPSTKYSQKSSSSSSSLTTFTGPMGTLPPNVALKSSAWGIKSPWEG